MDYPRPEARFGWYDEEEERGWYGPWGDLNHPGSTRRKKEGGGEVRETAGHLLLLLVLVWVVLYLVLRYLGGGE